MNKVGYGISQKKKKLKYKCLKKVNKKSISLASWEMQIKTTLRSHLSLVRKATIKQEQMSA